MNSVSQQRIILKDRTDIFNLCLPDKCQESQPNPKSHPKASPSLGFKRLSVYSKEKNQIPTVKEAKYRQKQIKRYHNRTFYRRKSHLEDIFKENMRLYQQLHKQKSYYEMNFRNQKVQKKSKKTHAVSCTDNYTTKYVDIEKGEDNFQEKRIPLERRYSFSDGRNYKRLEKDRENEQNSKLMIRPQSDFAINIKKRYEKNKTQMIPRKNRLKIEKSSELTSFNQVKIQSIEQCQKMNKIQSFLKNDKVFTVSKNPGYMRMKRRPSSGFRC